MTSEQTTTPTSSPSKSERDATVEAVNHLIQGKRHLLVRDITSAVNSLQEACRILAACYGETADECGDAYFHYGSALLELSRKESGILGKEKADSGSEEEESEEENEDDDNEVEEEESGDDDEDEKSSEQIDRDTSKGTTKEASKMGGTIETDGEMTKAGAIVDKVETKSSPSKEENKKIPTKDDSEAKSEDLEASKKADESTTQEETSETLAGGSRNEIETAATKDTPKTNSSAQISTTAEASTSADSSQPGTSQDKSAGDDDDDVTTLQLSWEVLELSKVIFKRQSENNREMQLRLAQVHLKLGEVAMESENYKQSIEDLLECFKIQHALLPADDRSIAEVYYQLGLAYTFDLQFDLAIESFKNAVQTLRDKMANVQKIADSNGTSEKDVVAAYNAKKEIEELNELLPEILEKITDTEYLKKHDLKLPEELNKDLVPEQFKTEIDAVDSTTGTSTSPSKVPKPVSSVAHLVRKKRKPEEDVSTNDSNTTGSKRPCIDELGHTNPVTASSSTVGSKINGTAQTECCPFEDTDKC